MIGRASHRYQRIAFTSANRVPDNAAAFKRQIHDIRERSAHNNETANLTGVLIFNTEVFGQILEGPPGAVEDTFERILLDARHSDISVLDVRPADTLIFPQWGMGFVGPDDDPGAKLGICLAPGFEKTALSESDLFARMHGLAKKGRLGACFR